MMESPLNNRAAKIQSSILAELVTLQLGKEKPVVPWKWALQVDVMKISENMSLLHNIQDGAVNSSDFTHGASYTLSFQLVSFGTKYELIIRSVPATQMLDSFLKDSLWSVLSDLRGINIFPSFIVSDNAKENCNVMKTLASERSTETKNIYLRNILLPSAGGVPHI